MATGISLWLIYEYVVWNMWMLPLQWRDGERQWRNTSLWWTKARRQRRIGRSSLLIDCRKEYMKEASKQGINGWYAEIPSWYVLLFLTISTRFDGVKTVKHDELRAQLKAKMCKDWLRAREGRQRILNEELSDETSSKRRSKLLGMSTWKALSLRSWTWGTDWRRKERIWERAGGQEECRNHWKVYS